MADFGLNITGSNVYLWSKEREGKNGKYRTYSVSLSNKKQDGTTEYMDADVQLPRNCPEIPNKTRVSFEGFPSFSSYIDKNGNEIKKLKIIVMNITLDDEPIDEGLGFAEAEADIPF